MPSKNLNRENCKISGLTIGLSPSWQLCAFSLPEAVRDYRLSSSAVFLKTFISCSIWCIPATSCQRETVRHSRWQCLHHYSKHEDCGTHRSVINKLILLLGGGSVKGERRKKENTNISLKYPWLGRDLAIIWFMISLSLLSLHVIVLAVKCWKVFLCCHRLSPEVHTLSCWGKNTWG